MCCTNSCHENVDFVDVGSGDCKGGGYKAIFGNYYGVFPQRDDGDCDIINMFSLAQHANCKK